MREFKVELRQLRQSSGLSIQDLADRSGISVATISRWERGISQPCLPELELVMVPLGASSEERRRIIQTVDAPRARRRLREEDQAATEDGITILPSPHGFLRGLRFRRGISQQQLADTLGVAQSSVARWERGDLWPSRSKLLGICQALGAYPVETEALLRNPSSFDASAIDEPISFEEASDLSCILSIQLLDWEKTELIELQYLQLIARIWKIYPTWHDRGFALMGEIMARLSQWYLAAEVGSPHLTALARRAEAVRFAKAAHELAPNERSGLISLIILGRTISDTDAAGHRRHIAALEQWTELPLHRGEYWHGARINPAYCAWGLSDQTYHYQKLGHFPDAMLASEKACHVARVAIDPIEARFRDADHSEWLVRLGRATEAVKWLHEDRTGIKALNIWEDVLRREVSLEIGDRAAAAAGLSDAIAESLKGKQQSIQERLLRVAQRV